jgi:hypothetical protein
METYPCDAEMSVAACTRPMVDSPSGLAYSAYTTFYTHAESMCALAAVGLDFSAASGATAAPRAPPARTADRSRAPPRARAPRRCYYLQSEAFQQATEAAVDRLHSSAASTATQLGALEAQAGEVIGATERILSEQAAAAAAAQALLEGQRAAAGELDALRSSQAAAFATAEASLGSLSASQDAAFAGLRRGAEELGAAQAALLGGLDRVLGLQSTLLGEFMDLRAVVFYCAAVLLTLALTSTAKTGAARLPIFGLLTANAAVEKLLVSVALRHLGADVATLNAAAWACRRLATLASALALVWAVVRYTDVSGRTLSGINELKAMHAASSEQLRAKLERLEAEAEARARKPDASSAAKDASLQALRVALRKRRASFSPARTAAPGGTSPCPSSGSSGRSAVSPAPARADGHASPSREIAEIAVQTERPPAAAVGPPTLAALGSLPGVARAADSAADDTASISSQVADHLFRAPPAKVTPPPAKPRASRRRSSIGAPAAEDPTPPSPLRRSARVQQRHVAVTGGA